MPVEGSYNKPKEPLGSFLLKAFFVVIVIIIGAIILFGFVFPEFDIVKFIVNIIGLVLMIGLGGLAIKGLLSFIKPKPFSPTEDFRGTMVRLSSKLKPLTVKNLYLRGEDMRMSAKLGRIKGLGFAPYVVSRPLRDRLGKPVYEKDSSNNIVYEKQWSKADNAFVDYPKPKYETIEEKDGDVIITISKFNFPMNIFFQGIDIIRAHKNYLSDLVGDIYIKDVGLSPYGEYLYPSKQWQSDIIKIMKQNEAEAIIQTHRNNLDLVSTVTQMSLGADPTFQKIMLSQSERLTSGFSGNSGGQ